jgi:GTP-binding protein
MSALKDANIKDILKTVISSYEKWNKKISTSKLNNWLRGDLPAAQMAPMIKGRSVKLKFIAQVTTRPPSFVIHSNFADLPEYYIRFLRNKLAQDFDIIGVPIRIIVKKADNPFADKRIKTSSTTTTKRRRYNK